MFYDVDGAGVVPDGPMLRQKPTLVLVHGSEVDHAFFKPWVTPLAGVAQLVFVDLLGHGRSDDGDETDWTITAWADAVAELCAGIGLDSPVVLGSSLGGRIALSMAIRHRRLVAGLIVVNSVLRGRPDRRIEIFRALGGEEAAAAAQFDIEHRSAESKERYMRLCMPLTVQRPYSDDELARLRPASEPVMDALIRLSQAPDDLSGRVSAIECRALVMTGDLDPAAPPGDADDLVAAIGPNAQLRVVAGAGHGVYRDQPEEFNDIVRAFLSKLESELA
jgi:proline iminopeptidase